MHSFITLALASSLLIGVTLSSPLKPHPKTTSTSSFSGTSKIYALYNGKVTACLDKLGTWVTSDFCDDFTVHELPGSTFYLTTSTGTSSELTCQAHASNGLFDCSKGVTGDISFEASGRYLSYGDGEGTSWWAQRVPREGGPSRSEVAAKSDRTEFTVPVSLMWGGSS